MNPFSEEMNELFEKMASGEGSLEQRNLFFKELDSNPQLKRWYQEHLDFRKGIEITSKRSFLRSQIASYHQQSKISKTKGSNPISISRWAIAASISALIVVGAWMGYEWEQKSKNNGELLLARSTRKITKKLTVPNSNTFPEEEMSTGTAFAVNSEGFFLSTHHIIGNKNEVLLENPEDGSVYSAKVVARDLKSDLVLVKITDEGFTPLSRIPYPVVFQKVSLAQEVFTLGFPKDDIVFGEGSISSLNGFNGDTIKYQVSVPVNPGQSGSPLFDESGNLIGVMSAKNLGADGVSYSIKSSEIINFLETKIDDPIELPKSNLINKLGKTKKIEKIKPFIFIVRA